MWLTKIHCGFATDCLQSLDNILNGQVYTHFFPIGIFWISFGIKDNQPTLRTNIEKLIPAPPADFSPSRGHRDAGGPP